MWEVLALERPSTGLPTPIRVIWLPRPPTTSFPTSYLLFDDPVEVTAAFKEVVFAIVPP